MTARLIRIARSHPSARPRARPAPLRLSISEFPGASLRSPLTALLEPAGDYYLARLPELDLWAEGATGAEALAELKRSLAQLAADLHATPDAALGPRPQQWKHLLARLVRDSAP